ncbi:MAG: adenine deaminase [Desulfobacterales bacterium CG23_combo_of_CG06-09_8_20_14_all_51_8]|nr:MAG: adenine deaminase [Desulfobacterales bacterium CG23_combo_of_CG06-09_8_20_14_all_51_8]
MNLENLISAARGDMPADCLFTNAKIINVFSREIISGHIAVADGYIVGLGDYPAKKTVDLQNRYVAPGFIDAHVHIESSMTSPAEFARAVVCRGTTSVVADPHEIANVMGTDGIDYMLAASEQLPVNVFFTMPSCVPATAMETAGAVLGPEAVRRYLNHERIVGLAEMMNFPGVIFRDAGVLEKILAARAFRKIVDGHSPGVKGKDLNAYVAASIASDHECTRAAEAMEKLRLGMYIMIREGTGAKNLDDLLPVVNAKTAHRVMWCTDDRHPHDICTQGHIDFMIRKAVTAGLDPVTAISIGTINAARYFGLNRVGAIAPGRRADLVVFSDLERPVAEEVYTGGRLAAIDGRMNPDVDFPPTLECPSTMNVQAGAVDLRIPAEANNIRVMELVPRQIVTGQRVAAARIDRGFAVSDPSRDILKIAVIERHNGTGNVGKGFVSGFGLKKGAIAGSVAHDSHNIIVVGVSDEDMMTAVRRIIEMRGGLTAACDGAVISEISLPIAGLMSDKPLETVRNRMDALTSAARNLGAIVPDPFMILSFLALPVIPELKLTDQGLFDVNRFCHVPLFIK